MNDPIIGPLPYMIRVQKLVLTPKTKEWCAAPYYNKKGCPNYWGRCWQGGKIPMVMFNQFVDIHRPMWIVYNEFDLAAHMARMKIKHPDWSERQLRNVYYWQNQSRAQLEKRIKAAVATFKNPNDLVVSSGEGNGVNVYATCFYSGLKLEKIRDLKICRHLVIIGYPYPRTQARRVSTLTSPAQIGRKA